MKLDEITNNLEISKKYDIYLTQHKNNVEKSYEWLKFNLPDLIPTELELILEDNILTHDQSKYSDEEYLPYAEYFYKNKTAEIETNFNYAWLHHIHKNPHHWQHWVLIQDDDPVIVLDMPYEYIIEMICDWWAFSWNVNNLNEIFNWYNEHKANIQLSKKTKDTVEDILNKIKDKL